ncbi:hypothetical protein KKC94_04825 [Patescibacteria group bacterium]|nr:hypothetical protein [Patescibacteria group bacterium]
MVKIFRPEPEVKKFLLGEQADKTDLVIADASGSPTGTFKGLYAQDFLKELRKEHDLSVDLRVFSYGNTARAVAWMLDQLDENDLRRRRLEINAKVIDSLGGDERIKQYVLNELGNRAEIVHSDQQVSRYEHFRRVRGSEHTNVHLSEFGPHKIAVSKIATDLLKKGFKGLANVYLPWGAGYLATGVSLSYLCFGDSSNWTAQRDFYDVFWTSDPEAVGRLASSGVRFGEVRGVKFHYAAQKGTNYMVENCSPGDFQSSAERILADKLELPLHDDPEKVNDFLWLIKKFGHSYGFYGVDADDILTTFDFLDSYGVSVEPSSAVPFALLRLQARGQALGESVCVVNSGRGIFIDPRTDELKIEGAVVSTGWEPQLEGAEYKEDSLDEWIDEAYEIVRNYLSSSGLDVERLLVNFRHDRGSDPYFMGVSENYSFFARLHGTKELEKIEEILLERFESDENVLDDDVFLFLLLIVFQVNGDVGGFSLNEGRLLARLAKNLKFTEWMRSKEKIKCKLWNNLAFVISRSLTQAGEEFRAELERMYGELLGKLDDFGLPSVESKEDIEFLSARYLFLVEVPHQLPRRMCDDLVNWLNVREGRMDDLLAISENPGAESAKAFLRRERFLREALGGPID